MLFRPEKSNPYRPKKTNWISPRLIAGALAAAAVVLMLVFAPLPGGESSSPFARVLLAPVGLLQSVRGFATDTISRISDRFVSQEELAALRAELGELNNENVQLRYKLQRHEAYVDALRLPREVEYQTLPAIVRYRDIRLTRDLIINRGAADGLAKNMPVWTGEGLVGRLRRVSDHYARVQAITDPGSSIGVYVEGTPYEGVLRGGDAGDELILDELHYTGFVDEARPLEPGLEVRTSGTGLVFPSGLLAGVISDATSPTGLVVEPAVNMQTVQSVLVFTNTGYRDEILSLISED